MSSPSGTRQRKIRDVALSPPCRHQEIFVQPSPGFATLIVDSHHPCQGVRPLVNILEARNSLGGLVSKGDLSQSQ